MVRPQTSDASPSPRRGASSQAGQASSILLSVKDPAAWLSCPAFKEFSKLKKQLLAVVEDAVAWLWRDETQTAPYARLLVQPLDVKLVAPADTITCRWFDLSCIESIRMGGTSRTLLR